MSDALKTVALTGATGFVGRHVLPRLLQEGYHVRILVREPRKLQRADDRLHVVKGDLHSDRALVNLLSGADALVHLVGIIEEQPARGQTFERVHVQATRRLLDVAQSSGIRHWVHMSALGARPESEARYHTTKWKAESILRDSAIPLTVFRPSVIHGPDGEFMQMVKAFAVRPWYPFMPYFAAGPLGRSGGGRIQPVWVEDVARCFVDALRNPQAIGEIYPLGGPDIYTWPSFYESCKAHIPDVRPNRRPRPIPVWYARLIAGLPGVPFNLDQVIMSQDDNTCSAAKAEAHFGFLFAPFEEALASYARAL